MPQSDRLQKVLAGLGLGSRRTCEELIHAGRVTINGRVASLGDKADVEVDRIEVDGVRIGTKPGLVYYLLNKPAGVVTSAADTHGRPVVTELVPTEPRRRPDTSTHAPELRCREGVRRRGRRTSDPW